jgi:hypothetical protein
MSFRPLHLMRLTLHCPSCSRLLGDLPSLSSSVNCAACRISYGLVHGKLSRRSSVPEILLHLTAKLPSIYKRHYRLQITTPDRSIKILQFSIPGRTDEVYVRRGDLVSALYTVQGYVMKQLVAVTNHTTGRSYVLPTPIPSRGYTVVLLTIGAIGLLLGSLFVGGNVFLVSAVSAVGIALYLKVTNVAQLNTPSLDTFEVEDPRLMSDQRLLIQKQKLEHRLDEIRYECKASQTLVDQLESLQHKMQNLDAELYSARISRTRRAVEIIRQQIHNSRQLMQEYSRTLKMIEIETETSWIADQLPNVENFTQMILRRLEELRAIEEQNQNLRLQLVAYEEVGHYKITNY